MLSNLSIDQLQAAEEGMDSIAKGVLILWDAGLLPDEVECVVRNAVDPLFDDLQNQLRNNGILHRDPVPSTGCQHPGAPHKRIDHTASEPLTP